MLFSSEGREGSKERNRKEIEMAWSNGGGVLLGDSLEVRFKHAAAEASSAW